jgi:mannose/fructose/N-acetylgalactosamine-specific phosphotransferase system component IIC
VDLFHLTLLGGLLALDGTSVGQFMVSRPLVAGVLTGWIVGDPLIGLLVGGILEVYFIAVFPVGGAEFPEGGPPTVVAVAAGAALAGPGGVAVGVFFGFIWSRVCALSVRGLRRLAGRFVPEPARHAVTPARVVWTHLAIIGLDFSRAAFLTLLGLGLGRGITPHLEGVWPLAMAGTLGILAVGACVPAGAFVRSLGGWKRRGVLFGVGILGGVLGSWWL